MAPIETHCDLCGRIEYSGLYRGNLNGSASNAAAYYSSSRFNAGYYPIVRCAGCNLVRSSLRDDDLTLSDIYTRLEDGNYEAEAQNRKRTALSYLNLVSRFCHEPQNLLDIGCSTGIFLSAAQQAGWNVTGLEPSLWAADIASSRLSGTEIVVSTLEKADFPVENFDVITMWDVIEHLPYPSEVLLSIHRWLKPSGWLFLNTPNIASIPARALGASWMLLLREHIWYFSPQTLQMLLAKCMYRLASTSSNLVWFSIGTILSRINQYHNPQLIRISRALLDRRGFVNVPLRFPIGEITVAAQKV